MSPLLWGAVAIAWIAIGLWGAAWFARANQRRGERRIPAVERRVAWVYVAGALAGPAAPALGAVLIAWLRRVDRVDERAAERAKARRFARRRAERAAEDEEDEADGSAG